LHYNFQACELNSTCLDNNLKRIILVERLKQEQRYHFEYYHACAQAERAAASSTHASNKTGADSAAAADTPSSDDGAAVGSSDAASGVSYNAASPPLYATTESTSGNAQASNHSSNGSGITGVSTAAPVPSSYPSSSSSSSSPPPTNAEEDDSSSRMGPQQVKEAAKSKSAKSLIESIFSMDKSESQQMSAAKSEIVRLVKANQRLSLEVEDAEDKVQGMAEELQV